MGTTDSEYSVVIAGGGPTGLMLAGELALAGIGVAVVEKRTSHKVDGSRAGGLHSRTIEVLDQRGIAERFIDAGEKHSSLGYAGFQLDISDIPTRHNYVLALWQSRFEPILADWVAELGVPILRGREVVSFSPDNAGVDIEVSDGQTLRSEYLVGCDGGRSLIRKLAGIGFPGTDPSTRWIIAEVEMDEQPEYGIRRDLAGTQALGPAGDGKSVRVVLIDRDGEHEEEPDLDRLRNALFDVYGTDFGLRCASWISRFSDMTRQAASYRRGRILLAGDAAHVHGPMGGQGLNTCVQDAVNLGWKLAQVVNGTSKEDLLDTYHAERHPVGARVLHSTLAQVALGRGDDQHLALRDTMAELLGMNEPRKTIAAMIAGLDIHYDFGKGHPLLGRRMPDLDIHTSDGPKRIFSLLHKARPVLLNFGEPDSLDSAPWAERIRIVDARCDEKWELPVLGQVAAPTTVLVRPDGHVAWVKNGSHDRLAESLATWVGQPA